MKCLCKEEKSKFLAEHFFYEVEMLILSYAIKPVNQFQVNLRLELFLLHARSLYEFFYVNEKRNKADDARASDFVIDVNKWEKERPQRGNNITQNIRRMNKEVSHITYKRHYGVPLEKQWELESIKEHLISIIKVFLNNVDNGAEVMRAIVSLETAIRAERSL